MSLQVLGPKPYFWQWDTGRRLEVTDAECGEVHFCNGTDDCALVVAIKTADDGARVVEVPNILLQTAKPIRAYLFQRQTDGTKTRTQYTIQVLARTKPADYVYTETEVKTYETLQEDMEQLRQDMARLQQANGIASIEQTTTSAEDGGINVVTVTMLDDSKVTFQVRNGSKGSDGATGKDGAQGPAGSTPVKGTDYWTEAEKAEIVSEVVEAIANDDEFLKLTEEEAEALRSLLYPADLVCNPTITASQSGPAIVTQGGVQFHKWTVRATIRGIDKTLIQKVEVARVDAVKDDGTFTCGRYSNVGIVSNGTTHTVSYTTSVSVGSNSNVNSAPHGFFVRLTYTDTSAGTTTLGKRTVSE